MGTAKLKPRLHKLIKKSSFSSSRFSRTNLIIFALIFAALGGYLIFHSFAAGSPDISAEAENGTLSGNASTLNDTNASGGAGVRFGTASNSNCVPLSDIPSGFPNNCTTGYAAAPDYPGSLHSCSGTIQSNTTYSFCDFSGGLDVGTSSTAVSNVTFHGCRVHGVAVDEALVLLFGDNITFEYSTVEPNAAFAHNTQVAHAQSYQYGIEANGSYNSHVGKLTITNSDFWGFGNAIDVHGSTQAKPQVFRDNWIHDAANDGGGDYHTDGIGDESGSGSGSYVVMDHNTIVSPGNTNGIAFQQGSYSNFTITNNLLGGFGYTVALWAPAPNTTFTGNTFTTLLKPDFGPLYPQSFWTSTGSIWKNNLWLVPSGAAYGSPADNGKFWTPNGPSATDYSG